MTVQIILPERSEDSISNDLRYLTETLDRNGLADASGYGLGGEFGYGADFENDTFLLHAYCWCEEGSCRWCGEEYAPNFLHKPTGTTVHWYKYIGRGMEVEGSWSGVLDSCLASIGAPRS